MDTAGIGQQEERLFLVLFSAEGAVVVERRLYFGLRLAGAWRPIRQQDDIGGLEPALRQHLVDFRRAAPASNK